MNHRGVRSVWVTCALALALAACSGIPQHVKDQEVRERYLAYAGAPIDRFTYLGRFDSWSALSQSDLVVWTNFNTAYLLTVAQPCIGLQFTSRIGVSNTSGTVDRGLDSVLVDRQRCQITEIRPVDYRRMSADRRNAAH